MSGRGAHSLQGRLDIDVAQIVDQLCANRDDLPRLNDVQNAIQSSNSALRRKPRKQLEASIERVLAVMRADRLRDDDFDDDDDEGPSEGQVSDRAAVKDVTSDPVNSLNRSLAKMYAAQSSNINGSKPAENDASQPESRKRKGRPEEPSKRRKIDRTPPPGVALSDLGGIGPIVSQLHHLLLMPLLSPAAYEKTKLRPPRGILLYGPPGCGKTVLANAFAAEVGVPFISLSAPSVVSGMSGESEKALRDHFDEAKKIAPCIIFIDEIDAITPKRDNAQRQMETRIVAQLLTLMDDLALERTGGKPVIVMAATNRPDSLDPALRRGGRFDKEINMPVPNESVREQILAALTREMPLDGELQLSYLAKRTAGYVGADLRDLVDTAGSLAMQRYQQTLENDGSMEIDGGDISKDAVSGLSPEVLELRRAIRILRERQNDGADLSLSQKDFDDALPLVQPSSKREGFATVPDTTWRNIGALEAVRKELITAIVLPIKEPELYRQVGINAPSGVLLWGPPGCGKTLLAKAVANESKANFISVKGPELLNKYVGESERAVRNVFTRARSSIPCVILFDELDALAPKRGSDIGESSARVVNTLLTELDGLDKREGIYVIGATNRPDVIDPAMLRPGRLETPLYVDLPGPEERVEILQTLCQNQKINFTPAVEELARKCERFSGADLEALRIRAGRCAIERKSGTIADEDWMLASRRMHPSVDEKAKAGFERLKARFGNSAIEEPINEAS